MLKNRLKKLLKKNQVDDIKNLVEKKVADLSVGCLLEFLSDRASVDLFCFVLNSLCDYSSSKTLKVDLNALFPFAEKASKPGTFIKKISFLSVSITIDIETFRIPGSCAWFHSHFRTRQKTDCFLNEILLYRAINANINNPLRTLTLCDIIPLHLFEKALKERQCNVSRLIIFLENAIQIEKMFISPLGVTNDDFLKMLRLADSNCDPNALSEAYDNIKDYYANDEQQKQQMINKNTITFEVFCDDDDDIMLYFGGLENNTSNYLQDDYPNIWTN